MYTGGIHAGELMSDIDLLIIAKNSSIKYQSELDNSSELADYLKQCAREKGLTTVERLLHIEVINRLPKFFHPEYKTIKRMLHVGTLIYGHLNPNLYGKHRDGGSPDIRPDTGDLHYY